MSQPSSKPLGPVIINSLTWARDSHGLFDYESRNIIRSQLQTEGDAQLLRTGNHVQLMTESLDFSLLGPDHKPLLQIDQRDGQYFISSTDESEPIWLIVKDMGNSGHLLSEGDVIKLGRVKFRVAEIKAFDDDKRSEGAHTTDSSDNESFNEEIPEERESRDCRICYVDIGEKDNPLISPCNCKGGMKYIHLGCLRRWTTTRMTSRYSEHSVSYFWRSMECELCKFPLPNQISHQGKPFELFHIEKPESPYLILEAVTRERNGGQGIHVINMTNKENIRLGRGHDSDVRISDISVSRCHALIRFQNGQFVLDDNRSKFGTLVQQQEPLRLEEGNYIGIQSGRTIFSIGTKGSGEIPVMEDMEIDEFITKPMSSVNQSLQRRLLI